MCAFARHVEAEAFYIHALANAHFDAGCAEILGPGGDHRPCRWVPPGGLGGEGIPPTLLLPGAALAPFAWRRQAGGRTRAYSLVGVLEQLAEPAVFDDAAGFAGAPIEPWDAAGWSKRPGIRSRRASARSPAPKFRPGSFPLAWTAANSPKHQERARSAPGSGAGPAAATTPLPSSCSAGSTTATAAIPSPPISRRRRPRNART